MPFEFGFALFWLTIGASYEVEKHFDQHRAAHSWGPLGPPDTGHMMNSDQTRDITEGATVNDYLAQAQNHLDAAVRNLLERSDKEDCIFYLEGAIANLEYARRELRG